MADLINNLGINVSDENRERILSDLNSTLQDYSGPNRTSSESVYQTDSDIISTLNDSLTTGDQKDETSTPTATDTATPTTTDTATPKASDEKSEIISEYRYINRSTYLLASADKQSAKIAIQDAERAIAIAENRTLSEDAISEAKARLGEAKTAYEAGDVAIQDAGDCCTTNLDIESQKTDLRLALSERKTSINQMRTAYENAQAAIGILDEAGLTRLQIQTRRDVSVQQNRTIGGTIFVTGRDEVSEVYVEINEDQTLTVPVEKPDRPLANATFGFYAQNLSTDTNRIRVTANSSAVNNTTDAEAPVASDVLLTDGDGLPDQYEKGVTQTNPANPDSDSAATQVNESGNNIIDSLEDFDNDTLTTTRERALGTDPLQADTDGDGLDDAYEVRVTGTNPLSPDSDQDGVSDALENPDGDTLTNRQEKDLGTNPSLADSDSDGLNDPDEITRETDPFNPDTDDDLLQDGTEVESPFNTNPNDPDTDDDGTIDGNETYTTTASNLTRGVEVKFTGEGDVAGTASIGVPDNVLFEQYAPNTSAVSAFTNIEVEREFKQADVTLTYDQSDIQVGDESTLSIYRYNESQRTYERIESSTDPVSNTVTASVEHFSTYVVFDTAARQRQLQSRTVPRVGEEYITDSERNITTEGLVFTREQGPEGPRILVHLQDGNNKAAGKVTIRGGNIQAVPEWSTAPLEQGSDGSPTVSATTTTCDDDEVTIVDNETVDFNLATCPGNDDGFFIEYTGGSQFVVDIENSSGIPAEPYLSGSKSGTARTVRTIDSFEDGSLSDYQDYTGDKSVISINQNVAFEGSDSLQVGCSCNQDGVASVSGLANYPRLGQTITYRLNFSESSGEEPGLKFLYGYSDFQNTYNIVVDKGQTTANEDRIKINKKESGAVTRLGEEDISPPLNEWMEVELGWESDGQMTVTVRNESGVRLASATASDTTYTDGGVGFRTLDARGSDRYVDQVRISPPPIQFSSGEGIPLIVDDFDGDGIPDRIENQTYPLNEGPKVTTDWKDPDMDGDGLKDGEEVTIGVSTGTGFYWTSDPTVKDTDGDTVVDGIEVNGQTIHVEQRSGYSKPYKWDPSSSSTVTFTSNPKKLDSDTDGLTDSTELQQTKTDPESIRTYAITDVHQEEVVNRIHSRYKRIDGRLASPNGGFKSIYDQSVRSLGLIGPNKSTSVLADRELTDATDDFDFVYKTSSSQTGLSRYVFRSQDVRTTSRLQFADALGNPYVLRSDTWMVNAKETGPVGFGGGSTNPWQADTDRDSLTDGQEQKWVTRARYTNRPQFSAAIVVDEAKTYDTDPTNPDTDGDGFWDGWIGVYGADESRNIVLYAQNLQSGNGTTGGQAIQAQIGVHDAAGIPTETLADIDNDGNKEHSNLHVGELTWGSQPDDSTSTPNNRLEVEVDWLNGGGTNRNLFSANNANGTNSFQKAEQNFAIYGLDVEFYKSDNINFSEASNLCAIRVNNRCQTKLKPTELSAGEMNIIENTYHNQTSRMHLLVGTKYGDVRNNISGQYVPHDRLIPSGVLGLTGHTGSPTTSLLEEANLVPYGVVIFRDETNMGSFDDRHKVLMHEIGHAMSAGWVDDEVQSNRDYLPECYSGGPCIDGGEDPTAEIFLTPTGKTKEWSVMAIGFEADSTSGNRVRLSIEELVTLELEDVPTKEDQ